MIESVQASSPFYFGGSLLGEGVLPSDPLVTLTDEDEMSLLVSVAVINSSQKSSFKHATARTDFCEDTLFSVLFRSMTSPHVSLRQLVELNNRSYFSQR